MRSLLIDLKIYLYIMESILGHFKDSSCQEINSFKCVLITCQWSNILRYLEIGNNYIQLKSNIYFALIFIIPIIIYSTQMYYNLIP